MICILSDFFFDVRSAPRIHQKQPSAYIDKGGTEISASYREATDGESAGCRIVAMPAVMPHIYRLRRAMLGGDGLFYYFRSIYFLPDYLSLG